MPSASVGVACEVLVACGVGGGVVGGVVAGHWRVGVALLKRHGQWGERGEAAERGAMTAADRQRHPSHDGGAVPTDIWHAMSGSGGGVREGRAWEQVGGAVVGVGVRVAGGHLKRQHQRRVRHDVDALGVPA